MRMRCSAPLYEAVHVRSVFSDAAEVAIYQCKCRRIAPPPMFLMQRGVCSILDAVRETIHRPSPLDHLAT